MTLISFDHFQGGIPLEEQGLLDLRETFIDGTFSAAKKGARTPCSPRKAKGPRS